MINNRQNGRRRGRGGGQGAPRPNGAGGGQDRGNRIDNRARGNAAQLHEKYKALARDAQMQGDRVNTEYYLQFADHYFRVLSESRSRFEEQQPRPRRDDYQNQSDDDYGDEGDRIGNDDQRPAPEPIFAMRETNAQRDFGDSDGEVPDGNRADRPERSDRPYRAERQERAERPERAERQDRGERTERPQRAERQDRNERPERAERAERPQRVERSQRPEPAERVADRQERPAVTDRDAEEERRPRRGRPARAERPEAPAAEPARALRAEAPAPVEPAPVEDVPAARRRGRPPKAKPDEQIEVDRLPPSFSLKPTPNAEDVEKPRTRTRKPRGEPAAI